MQLVLVDPEQVAQIELQESQELELLFGKNELGQVSKHSLVEDK